MSLASACPLEAKILSPMAKRGVSADEKMCRIVNFFRARPEVYTMKELDTRLPKECGIPSMKVGELVKTALDDDLIMSEKCGNTNIYWLFPMQKHHFHQCEIEKGEAELKAYDDEIGKMQIDIESIEREQMDDAERGDLLREYERLKARVEEIEEERRVAADCSKDAYDKIQRETAACRGEVNSITDNIYTIQSYVVKSFGMEKREFNKSFRVPDELDYL